MRKSTIAGVVLMSFIVSGCSEVSSPTSPSATLRAAEATGGPGASQVSLNWEVTASGCAPERPLPDVHGSPTHTRALAAGELHYQPGAIIASWMRDQGDTVWAVFYPNTDGHALCFWDTAGI